MRHDKIAKHSSSISHRRCVCFTLRVVRHQCCSCTITYYDTQFVNQWRNADHSPQNFRLLRITSSGTKGLCANRCQWIVSAESPVQASDPLQCIRCHRLTKQNTRCFDKGTDKDRQLYHGKAPGMNRLVHVWVLRISDQHGADTTREQQDWYQKHGWVQGYERPSSRTSVATAFYGNSLLTSPFTNYHSHPRESPPTHCATTLQGEHRGQLGWMASPLLVVMTPKIGPNFCRSHCDSCPRSKLWDAEPTLVVAGCYHGEASSTKWLTILYNG